MKRAPKRILLGVNSVRQGGGIAQVARNLINVIQAKANDDTNLYQFKTIFFDRGNEKESKSSSKSLIANLRFFLAFRKVSFGYTHFIYDSCNMAQVHPRSLVSQRPSLTYIHGIEVWENARPNWIRACHRSDRLISNSLYTKNRAEKIHRGFSRARVCWLGTKTDKPPKDAPALTLRKPDVLIVGRMDNCENYKGHVELIKLWPQVIAEVPGARLHIVGAGSGLQFMEELTRQTSAAEHIIFHGYVPSRRIEELYSQVRVFAMPSRGEGFGVVYIEAMRHGLPVIASVHDAAKEIVIHEETGFTVNLDQSQDLPNAIIMLLKNPQYAELLGRAGRKRWQENFTFNHFKERFSVILDDFIDDNLKVANSACAE